MVKASWRVTELSKCCACDLFCSVLSLSVHLSCPRDLLIPVRPLAGDRQALTALALCRLWRSEMRGSLCFHPILLTPAREWAFSKIIHMPKYLFMVKGTSNECKSLRFPPWATGISIFSNVTQVLQWLGHRDASRGGPHHADRRALYRTLHFSTSPLLLLELLSDFDHPCPSVTAFPFACWLSGCQLSQPCMSMKPTGFSLLHTLIPLC